MCSRSGATPTGRSDERQNPENRFDSGVPLTTDAHEAIRHEAAERGIDEAALIHEWVRERLGRT
jgi:hypothetical protein